MWSFGRGEMVQHRDAVWNAARQRLAVAAPAALDCALGLGQQLETMVEALREERVEGDVPLWMGARCTYVAVTAVQEVE
ncbi:hypothetical protein MTO96_050307 [Rhipicephalus appendiculatus]